MYTFYNMRYLEKLHRTVLDGSASLMGPGLEGRVVGYLVVRS